MKLEIKPAKKRECIFDTWYVVACCLLILAALWLAEHLMQ